MHEIKEIMPAAKRSLKRPFEEGRVRRTREATITQINGKLEARLMKYANGTRRMT
jgi:hypothetical protein